MANFPKLTPAELSTIRVNPGFDEQRLISDELEEIREILSRILPIGPEVQQIHKLILNFAPKRHKPSFATIMEHVVTCEKAYGGTCPNCRGPAIVEAGRRIPDRSEIDHWDGRHLNKPQHTWLICVNCNRAFGQGTWTRRERQKYFDAYQLRRDELHGGLFARV